MAKVKVSSVIDAPIAEVWAAIRQFDAVAEVLPFVESSPTEDDREPTAVGAVRVVTQTDGAVFREVLVAHSDAERLYSYTLVGSPIPVRDHRTTLRVLPITEATAPWASGRRGSRSPGSRGRARRADGGELPRRPARPRCTARAGVGGRWLSDHG